MSPDLEADDDMDIMIVLAVAGPVFDAIKREAASLTIRPAELCKRVLVETFTKSEAAP